MTTIDQVTQAFAADITKLVRESVLAEVTKALSPPSGATILPPAIPATVAGFYPSQAALGRALNEAVAKAAKPERARFVSGDGARFAETMDALKKAGKSGIKATDANRAALAELAAQRLAVRRGKTKATRWYAVGMAPR